MIDGVGNGRSGADDADLANALHAYGAGVGVVLLDPAHVDLSDVGVGGDVVLSEVVVHVVAEALRPFAQARDQSAATEPVPALGIDRRFVADARIDRVESAAECR